MHAVVLLGSASQAGADERLVLTSATSLPGCTSPPVSPKHVLPVLFPYTGRPGPLEQAQLRGAVKGRPEAGSPCRSTESRARSLGGPRPEAHRGARSPDRPLRFLPRADDFCCFVIVCLSKDFDESVLQIHWTVMLPASAAILGHMSTHSFPAGRFISPVFAVTLNNLQSRHPVFPSLFLAPVGLRNRHHRVTHSSSRALPSHPGSLHKHDTQNVSSCIHTLYWKKAPGVQHWLWRAHRVFASASSMRRVRTGVRGHRDVNFQMVLKPFRAGPSHSNPKPLCQVPNCTETLPPSPPKVGQLFPVKP